MHLIKDENDEINEIVRKSYRGGITKVNEKYVNKELDSVISFDVNSLPASVQINLGIFWTFSGSTISSTLPAILNIFWSNILSKAIWTSVDVLFLIFLIQQYLE